MVSFSFLAIEMRIRPCFHPHRLAFKCVTVDETRPAKVIVLQISFTKPTVIYVHRLSTLPVLPGTYMNNTGAAECFPCPEGHYCDGSSPKEFVECPAGHYCPESTDASIPNCPSGALKGLPECLSLSCNTVRRDEAYSEKDQK